jgi:2-polyprenyl-6-hydroxyphenyl methylase / 3-demethylubiquinone-9 3-methyltransferase
MTATENVHPHEINKFGSMAERWWDPQGEFKTLHDINPLRI